MLERKERLNEVYDHLHNNCGVHTKAEFADKIQYARAYVSSALNGNEKYLTDKLFRSICEKFPQFNLDYLLTGNGELLTKKEPETAPIDKQQDALTYAAIQVGKMTAELSASLERVKQIETEYTAKLEELNKRVTYLEQIAKMNERIDQLEKLVDRDNYRIPGMESPQKFDLGIAAENHCDRKKAK